MSENQANATPHEEVLRQLMDPCIAKTECEHVAAREIDRLRGALGRIANMTPFAPCEEEIFQFAREALQEQDDE